MIKTGKKIIDGFPEYEFSEILSEGFEDVTSVEEILKAGKLLFKDYKYIRNRLKELDFNSQSDENKRTICKYAGASTSTCKTILGNEYYMWRDDFDQKSQKCRNIRWTRGMTIVIDNISNIDQFLISSYLEIHPEIYTKYIKEGREGLDYGDFLEGFFDFVLATPESHYYDLIDSVKVVKNEYLQLGVTNNNGTIIDALGNPLGKYQTDGILARSLTMVGVLTKQQMVDAIIEAVKEGNY